MKKISLIVSCVCIISTGIFAQNGAKVGTKEDKAKDPALQSNDASKEMEKSKKVVKAQVQPGAKSPAIPASNAPKTEPEKSTAGTATQPK